MPRRNKLTPEQLAAQLLKELGISEVPVPLDRIAAHLGARVIRQRMDSHVSGMTYRSDGVAVIGINTGHHPRRQRFTLAHELGHLHMHPGRPLLVDSSVRVDFRDNVSSLATDQQEIEANQFAAALVMPADAVRNHMQRMQGSGAKTRERLVTALARDFDVSPEALGYRLINLGLASP